VSAGSAARDRLKCGKRSYGEMDWVPAWCRDRPAGARGAGM